MAGKEECTKCMELQEKVTNLEAQLRSFTYVNEELCKAVNNGKHRQLLNFLLNQASNISK